MKCRIFALFFIMLFGSILSVKAQSDTSVTDTTVRPKKPLLLSFGLDLNLKTFSGTYNHDYIGEYNINGAGPTGWQWVTHKATYNNIRAYGPFTDVKLAVNIANSKIFQAGLSFNFGGAKITSSTFDVNSKPTTTGDTIDVIYAGISLMTQYNYYFDKIKYLGPYVFAGLDVGSYTGTDQVFGPGTPLYLQGRLGFGYNVKGDFMFKAFLSSDHLVYWENETSQVFQRTEKLNINLDVLYFGLGISKTFTLFPD